MRAPSRLSFSWLPFLIRCRRIARPAEARRGAGVIAWVVPTSYSLPGLFAQDALLVERGEDATRVVARLERPIRFATIARRELLRRVKTLRIQRLDPAQARHLALDLAVEVPRRMALAAAHHVPEAEVHVEHRGHPVEREYSRVGAGADGADPNGQDPNLPQEEAEELGGV